MAAVRQKTGGVDQNAFFDMRADYDAAKVNKSRYFRNRRIPTMGAGADYHIRNERDLMASIELSREFERNEPVCRQGVRRLVSNVGLGEATYDPDTGSDALDDYLRERVSNWWNDRDLCDFAQDHSIAEMADIGFARIIFDGDFFAMPIPDEDRDSLLRVQCHEAHRVRTPSKAKKYRGVCGAWKNHRGVRHKYSITREHKHPADMVKVDEVETYDTFETAEDGTKWRKILHCHNPERFGQSRGFGHLLPVVSQIGMRDDHEFAELVKAQTAACITFFEKYDIAAIDVFQQLLEAGVLAADQKLSFGAPNGDNTIDMAPGRMIPGFPGKELQAFSPNIPGPGFFEMSRKLLTYLAVNLDIPLMVLLLDASEANFSSFRNMMDQARMTFARIHTWFTKQFHRPIANMLIREMLRADDKELLQFRKSEKDRPRLKSSRIFNHKWHAKAHPYIQPVQDATRHVIDRANGNVSEAQYHASRGQDWKQFWKGNINQRGWIIDHAVQAKAKAIAAAPDELKAEVASLPLQTWANLPMPERISISLALSDKADDSDSKSGPDRNAPADQTKPEPAKAIAQ